jgi:hypothetical protein
MKPMTGALPAVDHPCKAVVMQGRLDEVLRRGGTLCIRAGILRIDPALPVITA